MKMGRSRGKYGFTAVELTLAMAMLATIGATVVLSLNAMTRAFSAGQTSDELDSDVREALDKVAGRLGYSALGKIDPVPPVGFFATEIDYQSVSGYDQATEEPIWGPPERLRLELAPGELDDDIDNDGDGLIDERQVVWLSNPETANERIVVIASDVAEVYEGEEVGDLDDDNKNGLDDEPGFCIAFDGNTATIYLTIEKVSQGGHHVVKNLERTISFRNAVN